MTCEDLYIKNIENAIRGLKLGKTPKEVNPSLAFEKLKELNFGMHQELLIKYKNAVDNFTRKQAMKNK